jgi:hypothetical protein
MARFRAAAIQCSDVEEGRRAGLKAMQAKHLKRVALELAKPCKTQARGDEHGDTHEDVLMNS